MRNKIQNIIIRKANIADVDTIANFNMAMAKETEGINLCAKTLKSGVKSVFEDENRGFYIVAECDSKVVGQLLITFEWSDWRNGVFWWIQSVYVEPGYRQNGVFKSLFEHLRNLADNIPDVVGFRLYVHKNNYIARKTYEKLGMSGLRYDIYETSF
ncbi:GNAT family N-acetyltransferase [Candidatus Poribacteria bacterium]|nr:GNAT family N-acetyltransferase [Candidatus Poribacteria bacterium]